MKANYMSPVKSVRDGICKYISTGEVAELCKSKMKVARELHAHAIFFREKYLPVLSKLDTRRRAKIEGRSDVLAVRALFKKDCKVKHPTVTGDESVMIALKTCAHVEALVNAELRAN